MLLVGIVVLALLAAVAFIIGLVFLIIFIVKSIRNDSKKKTGALVTFIVALSMFLVISSIDVFLVWNNRTELISDIIEETSEYSANALGTTIGEFGKYYDKTIIKRIGNMDITVEDSRSEVDGDTKIYTLSLAIDNKNDPSEKVYMHLLVENHYLVGCDDEDFIYDVIPVDYDFADYYYDDDEEDDSEDYSPQYASGDSYDKIPVGKTRHTIEVYIPKGNELSKLRYLDKEISIRTKE